MKKISSGAVCIEWITAFNVLLFLRERRSSEPEMSRSVFKL